MEGTIDDSPLAFLQRARERLGAVGLPVVPGVTSQEMVERFLVGMTGQVPSSWSEGELFVYPVPLLGEEGTCSLHGELAPELFDLRRAFGVQEGSRDVREVTEKLRTLRRGIENLWTLIRADWLGIYVHSRFLANPPAGPPSLVKVAYKGTPSRASFPLTEAFAAASNNVSAVLNRRAIKIDNIKDHRAAGGCYYECDPRVLSELVVPIIVEGEPVGILDVEAYQKAFFNDERCLLAGVLITYLCDRGWFP